MRFSFVRRLFVVGVTAIVVWAGYELTRCQLGYSKAIELASFGLWENARSELTRYLRLHPHDSQAHFLMADLWSNDDAIPGYESVPHAISHLEQIPDDSPLGATARTLDAKLQFLVLYRPVAAEKLLRKAISLDESDRRVYEILIKVMEMTDRYGDCEPLFWRTYELAPPAERAERLRDWYMSQFFPLTANDELDRQMGFTDAAQKSLPAEAVRYLRFREAEPSEPLGRAVLARWMRRTGKPSEALSLLKIDDASPANELQDPFFVATLVDSLIDLGEYEQAEERFRQWPGSQESFDYWRLKAILLEEVHGEYDSALEAYDAALAIWPGPAEWRLLHRKAGCLARAGQRDKAVETRDRAKVVEKLMENEVHKRLRYVLGFLNNPDNLREVAEFYRKLGRTREAEAWSREAASRIADVLE